MPVPDALDWAAAGGSAEVFTTAHDALFTQAGLGPGERPLVHGGAGGVGTAAVQLAAAAGARVSATVRAPSCARQVAALGAEVLDPEEFADAGPFDVILELVGAPNLPADLEALATGGRIVVIGVGAGAKAEVNLLALMAQARPLRASTLRARPLEEKAATARGVERAVLPLFEPRRAEGSGRRAYPLDEVDGRLRAVRRGSKLGKIVITPERG